MVNDFLPNTSKGLGMGKDPQEPTPRFNGLAVGEMPKCTACAGGTSITLKEVSEQNWDVLVCTRCGAMFDDNKDGTFSRRGV